MLQPHPLEHLLTVRGNTLRAGLGRRIGVSPPPLGAHMDSSGEYMARGLGSSHMCSPPLEHLWTVRVNTLRAGWGRRIGARHPIGAPMGSSGEYMARGLGSSHRCSTPLGTPMDNSGEYMARGLGSSHRCSTPPSWSTYGQFGGIHGARVGVVA